MDAVEHGTTFTVTRDGRGIGELIPLRRAPRFLSRDEIIRLGAGLGPIDVSRFRLDLDGALDGELGDSYAR
jgi:antitoxin (DNA-binding transcriptional repressor) of toxin-antitoxin stability system